MDELVAVFRNDVKNESSGNQSILQYFESLMPIPCVVPRYFTIDMISPSSTHLCNHNNNNNNNTRFIRFGWRGNLSMVGIVRFLSMFLCEKQRITRNANHIGLDEVEHIVVPGRRNSLLCVRSGSRRRQQSMPC